MTLLLASCSDSLPTRGIVTEAEGLVDNRSGFLVLDDTTLDKPYAQKTELVTYHWSGKHQKVVRGINLLTLLDRWKSPHTL